MWKICLRYLYIVHLLRPHEETLHSMSEYVEDITNFTRKVESYGCEFIKDLTPGRKHHSIHFITFTDTISSVIGMSINQFGNLYARSEKKNWLKVITITFIALNVCVQNMAICFYYNGDM